MKIDMQVVTKLSDDKLNVLVGGKAGAKEIIKGVLESLDININWNCKCKVVNNNVC